MEKKKKKKTTIKKRKYKSNYLTGEDIDMFNERKYENNRKRNICDVHIDGA